MQLSTTFRHMDASQAVRDYAEEKLDNARDFVAAINRGLRGIPRDRVRLHTCYGINQGPRVHDAPLAELIDTLFTIDMAILAIVN